MGEVEDPGTVAAVAVEQIGPPVDRRPLFAPQRANLVRFLRGLRATDWDRPTACVDWTVADVAAHILGDQLARISGMRDGARTGPGPDEDLPVFIDRVNDDWVVACRRLSPAMVVDLIEANGAEHDRAWLSESLDAQSIGVSWAGVEPAPIWFDAGRELTEYWVHEMQLREAVGDERSPEPGLGVVLDVFVRGLPFALAHLSDPPVDRVTLEAEGTGGAWTLQFDDGRWSLVVADEAETVFVHDAEFLWRRWTRQPGTTRPDTDHPIERAILDHVAIVHSAPGS